SLLRCLLVVVHARYIVRGVAI
ncbi:hypothetical protein A2U01_0116117, partial [Trifolium medium]|nr:hypothetical protein [Trifolium medium]